MRTFEALGDDATHPDEAVLAGVPSQHRLLVFFRAEEVVWELNENGVGFSVLLKDAGLAGGILTDAANWDIEGCTPVLIEERLHQLTRAI